MSDTPTRIRITEAWAKACGKTQRDYDVIRIEYRMVPRQDERTFYVVADGAREWTVWCIRVQEIDPPVAVAPVAYRVYYPGITQDLTRDFATREEADAFACARRNAELHMWRHVRIEAVPAGSIDTGATIRLQRPPSASPA
jgi:hypothetical protein